MRFVTKTSRVAAAVAFAGALALGPVACSSDDAESDVEDAATDVEDAGSEMEDAGSEMATEMESEMESEG
ncbi:MAG TPA: hypothetical protein VJ978_01275 [Nitriliruptoraceae bacterium]|nr:hypothetical protein [Nitriliruptoraceae bacterium]